MTISDRLFRGWCRWSLADRDGRGRFVVILNLWLVLFGVNQSDPKEQRDKSERKQEQQNVNWLVVPKVHEVGRDKTSLNRGDGQRDPNIDFTQVLIRKEHGQAGEKEQGDERTEQDRQRHDVGQAMGRIVGMIVRVVRHISIPKLGLGTNEIEQREQVDPDQVDQVPVKTDVIDRTEVLAAEIATD